MTSRRAWVTLLGIGVASATATQAYDGLRAAGLTLGVALAVSIVLAVAVDAVLTFAISNAPRRWSRTRHLVDDLAAFEGQWIETFEQDKRRLYSYVEIYFSNEDEEYHLRGKSFDQNGVPTMVWSAGRLDMRPAKGEISFDYLGKRIMQGFPTSATVQGYTLVHCFRPRDRGPFDHGQGYFMDTADNSRKVDFVIDRLPASFVSRALAKSHPESSIELSEVIRRWHAERGIHTQVGLA